MSMRIEGLAELKRALHDLPLRVAQKHLSEATRAGAEIIRERAGELAPREPGAPDLAENIGISRVRSDDDHAVTLAIGPTRGFFYGCVFGASTNVSTERGQKAICSIRPGDKVITQTGEARQVTAFYKYPATEKPSLVTITARYRSDRNHTLTVTDDHKIMVFRDGKHQWVEASRLVVGDALSRRRKTSWSEGTAVAESRVCETCGCVYQRRHRAQKRLAAGFSAGKRFCSHTCRAEWLASHHRGMQRSQAAKDKMAAASRERLASNPASHPNLVMAAKGYVTKHEKQVSDWLVTRDIAFVRQHRIGSLFVDFYLPDTETVIEADGAYWHQDQQRDIERDKAILEQQPEARIIHMHFADPRFTPQLDLRPFPNVVYVPCNPGPSSFVNPDAFEPAEVLSLKCWTYKREASRSPSFLYDIGVDGIHSFVASGLVIHNSFQEFGTRHHSAQPFMRPAFDTMQAAAMEAVRRVLWLALGTSSRSSGGGREL